MQPRIETAIIAVSTRAGGWVKERLAAEEAIATTPFIPSTGIAYRYNVFNQDKDWP